MSKGPGARQRYILAKLDMHRGEWLSVYDLAHSGLACGDPPTAAAIESTRRAAHKLAALGRVEIRADGAPRPRRMVSSLGYQVHVRLPADKRGAGEDG